MRLLTMTSIVVTLFSALGCSSPQDATLGGANLDDPRFGDALFDPRLSPYLARGGLDGTASVVETSPPEVVIQ